MSKFHISEDGVARRCTAQSPESCTATSPDSKEHYDTQEEAQKAYEQKNQTFESLSKKELTVDERIEKLKRSQRIIEMDMEELQERMKRSVYDPQGYAAKARLNNLWLSTNSHLNKALKEKELEEKKKEGFVEPGTMAPQEPVISYSITANIKKTAGPDEVITFDYKTLEEAQAALTNDPRLHNRPSVEKIDLSLSKTTEIIEYFEPEELEPEDETQFSNHKYVVHDTKFLNGRVFGMGSQGRTLPQSKAKKLFESSKKAMAESPYPEAAPYNPDTQSGSVLKIGRRTRVSEPIDVE